MKFGKKYMDAENDARTLEKKYVGVQKLPRNSTSEHRKYRNDYNIKQKNTN